MENRVLRKDVLIAIRRLTAFVTKYIMVLIAKQLLGEVAKAIVLAASFRPRACIVEIRNAHFSMREIGVRFTLFITLILVRLEKIVLNAIASCAILMLFVTCIISFMVYVVRKGVSVIMRDVKCFMFSHGVKSVVAGMALVTVTTII